MKLSDLMLKKKTRLCFSADFTKKDELFDWIELLGPYICILKTHIDILEDFDNSVPIKLNQLKNKYQFLILEDRKFSDIGKTFQRQLFNKLYKINEWADIITIHGITCHGMLQTLKNTQRKIPQVLIVSQMSSKNNIISNDYTMKCYEIAKLYPDLVMGFISQNKFVDDDRFLFLTPGVKCTVKEKIFLSLKENDQNYRKPREAIEKDKNDIIIVGSGIYNNHFDINQIITDYVFY